jgi:diguanylate cyclase (GGDEF)-like protein
VNDTHGHGAGDEVLCAVAQRLGGLVRQHDTAARLSGDEFVLVLGQLPEDWEREAFVDRAREQLGRPLLLRRGAGAVQLRPRASLGLVLTDPHDGTTSPSALDLLALADAQMYEEKRDRRVVRAG